MLATVNPMNIIEIAWARLSWVTRLAATTAPIGTVRAAPSRTTVAVGAIRAASLSSARFARTSWNVPIPMFANELRAVGVLTDEIEDRLRAEVKAEVNEASQRAEARPEPSADDAHERVYADPIPGGGTATPLAPLSGDGGSH